MFVCFQLSTNSNNQPKASTTNMPREKKEGWVNWRKCKGREILLEDLEPGGLLQDQDHQPVEVLYRFYKKLPEFEGVCLPQFQKQLKLHRNQALDSRALSKRDAEFLQHDRALHPRKKHNHWGEPVWDVHKAKKLLRKDIERDRHLTMTPSELRQKRSEYREFSMTKFREHIYQEVRGQNFLYFLELKRAKQRPSAPRTKVDLTVDVLIQEMNIDG